MSQIRLRDRYDWVVLGDNPGALLSACLAARLGLSVLVLPLGPSLRTTVSKSGHPLDPEPSLILGLGRAERTNGLLLQCLSHIGISPADAEAIRTHQDLSRLVVTPSSRVVFDPDFQKTQFELGREFGLDVAERLALTQAFAGAQEEIAEFWFQYPDRLKRVGKKQPLPLEKQLKSLDARLARIPTLSDRTSRHWLSRRWKISALAEKVQKPAVQDTLVGLWTSLTGEARRDASLPELLHAAGLGRTGASFRGGMTGYRDFLIRLAQRSGAHAPPGLACSQIFVEGGKFVGVQASQRGSMISVLGGVLGCSLEHALAVTSSTGSAFRKKLKSAPRAVGWRFTISLLVRSEAFPQLGCRRMIWQEEGAPALEIELAEPSNYGVAAPGATILFARTRLPFSKEGINPKTQRMVAGRMLRQLTALFPFLEYHVTRIHPDFTAPGIAAVDELSASYRFSSTSEIPESLRIFEGQGNGVGAESGIDGLFVASSESYPHWGSFGPTVAALRATGWLAEKFELAGPMV